MQNCVDAVRANWEQKTCVCKVKAQRLTRTRPPFATLNGFVEELQKAENIVVVQERCVDHVPWLLTYRKALQVWSRDVALHRLQ